MFQVMPFALQRESVYGACMLVARQNPGLLHAEDVDEVALRCAEEQWSEGDVWCLWDLYGTLA